MSLSKDLRDQLGLSLGEWARALSVSDQTVKRWEDGDTEPTGLHAEVMRGIRTAIDEGADPLRTGRVVSLGIGALITYELFRRCQAVSA